MAITLIDTPRKKTQKGLEWLFPEAKTEERVLADKESWRPSCKPFEDLLFPVQKTPPVKQDEPVQMML